ncbi:MAG: cytochrome b6-f complex subunit PetL [Cyanobacteria bacterium P01_C01_bin.89]|mgnify:CR=1 FL=1
MTVPGVITYFAFLGGMVVFAAATMFTLRAVKLI